MSPGYSIVHIVQADQSIRRATALERRDRPYFDLFCGAFVGVEDCSSHYTAIVESIVDGRWEAVDDLINPFGDERGCHFDDLWVFDLGEGIIAYTGNDDNAWLAAHPFPHTPSVAASRTFACQTYVVSLDLARERPLDMSDFESSKSSPDPTLLRSPVAVDSASWKPDLCASGRRKSFLGGMIRDLSHVWRHVLRRPMRFSTFTKFAYAFIWLSGLDFVIEERVGFEHIARGGEYVKVTELPKWKTPDATFVEAGRSCFVLARDFKIGLEKVETHLSAKAPTTVPEMMYAIMTPNGMMLCKQSVAGLSCTAAEPLFDKDILEESVIEMILLATEPVEHPAPIAKVQALPLEIQDWILQLATTSVPAAAKLGIELDWGSACTWSEDGLKLSLQSTKTHRTEVSPVESQILLSGIMCGLSYKRDRAPSPGRRGIMSQAFAAPYCHM